MFAQFPLRAVLLAVLTVGLVSSAVKADEAEDQYAVAAGLYAREQWKLAATEFETYLQRFPQGSKANQSRFFLAEALLQLGKADQAAARFREYLERDPDGQMARQALFRAGEAAYLAGHFDQARPQLEAFLTKYPSDKLNAYTLTYLGQIALTAKDYPTAEKHFRRALDDFPQERTQDECRYGLARALDHLGKTEEAERLYTAVAAKTGSEFADNAQFYLGALQYAQGRFEDALRTFRAFDTVFAKSPWRSSVQRGRGWALLKLGRPAEAKAMFESITSDPKLGVEARYWLGLAQKQLKDWKAAAATLSEAAAADPAHKLIPSIRFHAGDALIHAQEPAAAAEQFDAVLAAVGPEGELADDALRGKVQAAWLADDHATLDRLVSEFNARYAQSPLLSDVQRLAARSLIERKEYQRAAEILEPLVAAGDSGEQKLEDLYLLSLCDEGLGRPEDALNRLGPVLQAATGQLLADAQLMQGSQLVRLKRFQDAIAPLEAFRATQPKGDLEVKALGLLSICYARTDQLSKAKEVYGELIKKYPHHELMVVLTEQMAEAAYDAEQIGWAEKLFNWLGRDSHSEGYDERGLSGLGWSQLKAGKLEEAAATFEQLLQQDPDPQLAAEAALVRGQILQQLGKADQALAMYDLVIQKYPTSPQGPNALWAAARLHDSLGRHEQAVGLYHRLANEHPEFPELDAVLYKWGWSLNDLRRQEESTAVFERLHKEFPQSRYWADASFRLAQRAFEAKDYARAKQLAETVLNAKADAAIRESTLYLWGQIAAAENQWDQARQAFETLIAEHPESALKPLAEYGIAESWFRQGDYAVAAERLRTLAQATEGRPDPWLAVVHLRLAQALVMEKKWDEAYAVASQIEKKFPGFEEQYEADYVLGRCLANEADFNGAREAFRKVVNSPTGEKTETAAKAQFMIAESYFHQKNYAEALREYLRLEILYAYPTWQAAALLQAGKCREQLGEWKEAVDSYTRVLKTYPDTEFAKEAAQRLREAEERLAGPAS